MKLTGSFQVVQVVYGPGNTLVSFDAIFEQHCEGAAPALRGTDAIQRDKRRAVSHCTRSSPSYSESEALISGHSHRCAIAARLLDGSDAPNSALRSPIWAITPARFLGRHRRARQVLSRPRFSGDNKQGNVATTTTQISVTPPPPANDDFAAPLLIPSSSARYTQNVAQRDHQLPMIHGAL